MNFTGGGIRRIATQLAVSLLLHLAVLGLLLTVAPIDEGRRQPVLTRVELVAESSLGAGHHPQRSPAEELASRRPLGPQLVTPVTPSPLSVLQTSAVTVLAAEPSPRLNGTAPVVPDSRQSPRAPQETGNGVGGAATRGGSDPAVNGNSFGAVHADSGNRGGTAVPQGGSAVRRGRYEAQLKRLIEAHKQYPFAARKSGREGSCLRRFVVERRGSLGKVEALTSCGYGLLDMAATAAITRVGVFPPLPEEFPGGEATFTVTISFTLARE
jgi:protein TonB